jgi:hypothetical protein
VELLPLDDIVQELQKRELTNQKPGLSLSIIKPIILSCSGLHQDNIYEKYRNNPFE